jgi:hypothetical protein
MRPIAWASFSQGVRWLIARHSQEDIRSNLSIDFYGSTSHLRARLGQLMPERDKCVLPHAVLSLDGEQVLAAGRAKHGRRVKMDYHPPRPYNGFDGPILGVP